VVGGRFLAPFLMKLKVFSSSNHGEGWISAALAFQLGLEALLSGWCGSIADVVERRWWLETGLRGGRLHLLRIGVILGCVVFLSHYISIPWLWWQFFLRATFALARSLTMPILDGLTVAFLEEESSMQPSGVGGRKCYGRERMYGAVGWGIGTFIKVKTPDVLCLFSRNLKKYAIQLMSS
jgi:MFS family permease